MKKLILIVALFFVINSAYAAPPFGLGQSAFSEGYNIKVPFKEVFRINEPYDFDIHVFNISNGKPIISNISCYFHLYNKTGAHLYEGFDNTASTSFDYSFGLSSTNFSTLGQYYYIVQCNSTVLGGYNGEYIYVTAQGVPYTEVHGIIYSAIMVILVAIFLLIGYIFITIPWGNDRMEGKVLAVNWSKYFKIFAFVMDYVILIGIFYFSWNISYGILEFKEMAQFFYLMFRFMMIMILPVFTVILIVGVVQYIKDRNINEYLGRNLTLK